MVRFCNHAGGHHRAGASSTGSYRRHVWAVIVVKLVMLVHHRRHVAVGLGGHCVGVMLTVVVLLAVAVAVIVITLCGRHGGWSPPSSSSSSFNFLMVGWLRTSDPCWY